MNLDVEYLVSAACMAIVALALIAGVTACGMSVVNADTTRMEQCVQNGGQWLKVVNDTDFECRRL